MTTAPRIKPALNARQEAFARAVAEGCSQAQAYLKAGYVARSRNALDADASGLVRNAKVASRIAELQALAAAETRVTIASVTAMLRAAYALSLKEKQPGAATQAAMGLAKLHGLLVDRYEDVTRKPARHPDVPVEIEVADWVEKIKLQ